MSFKLIPISPDSFEWQCSILKLGGVTILLDCGWTEALDPKLLGPLIPHLGELDLILLSQADFKHLGALPYLLTKYNVTCPVVCTEATCRLGELACVGCLEDRAKYREPVGDLEIDDVLRVFTSRISPLVYRQTFHVNCRGRILAVSPFQCGTNLGSAYWTLNVGGLSGVYLVDWEIRRGRYLDGLELEKLMPACRGGVQRWDVLITSPVPALGSLLPQRGARQAPREAASPSKAVAAARNAREQLLLEETITTLRRGGTVLIPADVSGGVPELLLLFEAAWGQDRQLATNYPLVWLSSMGEMILDQLKTRLEYMSGEVLSRFEANTTKNPFVLRSFQVFETLEELLETHPLSRPKVIIASSAQLDSGDSRELFLRLCTEPRALLWLLGVPPAGSLARQLLDDHVLKRGARREYRLQQHVKLPLPEEQVRSFYEAKLQEMADSGQRLPPELAGLVSPKAEAEGGAGVKDEPGAAGGPASRPPPGGGVDARGKAGPAASLWTPTGWPASRTVAHSEWRVEGDEYGHALTELELAAWKAQDQEGNKYSSTIAAEGSAAGAGAAALAGAEETDAAKAVKEEAKIEEEQPKESITDMIDSLRVYFPEPMRCEVRDRVVRLSCRVRYLPDRSPEPADLCSLIQMVSPKHVVLLPSADELTSETSLAKFLSCSRPSGTRLLPEIHTAPAQEPWLQIPLRSLKRKVSFALDVWPRMTFLRTSDDVRVARVMAVPSAEGTDQRVLELGVRQDGSAEPAAAGAKLPRAGSLFLSLNQDSVSLSGLKEQLHIAEWSKDDVPVEFRSPHAQSGRPWSSRVLSAGGKAVLGWAGRAAGSAGAGAKEGAAASAVPVLRLEGVPGEEFFLARAAIYKKCALI